MLALVIGAFLLGWFVKTIRPMPVAVTAWADKYVLQIALPAVIIAKISTVTFDADVVLPVAVVTEKSGTFIDWEGRPRNFGQAIREHNKLTDGRVLAMIADAMDVLLGQQDVAQLRAELAQFAAPTNRVDAPSHGADVPNGLTLSTWNQLIDDGALQEGEPFLAATSRNVIAGLNSKTAAAHSIAEGDLIEISTSLGSITVEAIFAPAL